MSTLVSADFVSIRMCVCVFRGQGWGCGACWFWIPAHDHLIKFYSSYTYHSSNLTVQRAESLQNRAIHTASSGSTWPPTQTPKFHCREVCLLINISMLYTTYRKLHISCKHCLCCLKDVDGLRAITFPCGELQGPCFSLRLQGNNIAYLELRCPVLVWWWLAVAQPGTSETIPVKLRRVSCRSSLCEVFQPTCVPLGFPLPLKILLNKQKNLMLLHTNRKKGFIQGFQMSLEEIRVHGGPSSACGVKGRLLSCCMASTCADAGRFMVLSQRLVKVCSIEVCSVLFYDDAKQFKHCTLQFGATQQRPTGRPEWPQGENCWGWNRKSTQAVKYPLHQLRKRRHIGLKYRVPNPRQRQGKNKYAWKPPPKFPHSKSRGKEPDTPTH